MTSKLRPHLTYSNILASVAIFLALTGGAYALSVPAHSVGAKQLKKNAATAAKIKNGAVASAKVKDDSLTGADILESTVGQVPSASSASSAGRADSAATADSAKSADSAKTAGFAQTAGSAASADTAKSVADSSVGGNALKEIVTVESALINVPAGASNIATQFCPVGSAAIAGGLVWDVSPGTLTAEGDLLHTTESFRSGNGWSVGGGNASGTARAFRIRVYCLAG